MVNIQDVIGGVPGNPKEVRQAAQELSRFAMAFLRANSEASRQVGDKWLGRAGDAYRESLARLRGLLVPDGPETTKSQHALGARATVGSAVLLSYAQSLEDAQKDADSVRTNVQSEMGERDVAAQAGDDAAWRLHDARIQQLIADYGAVVSRLEERARQAADQLQGFTTEPNPKYDTTPLDAPGSKAIEQVQADIKNLLSGTYADWDKVKQGDLGNCSVISSLQAMLRTEKGCKMLGNNVYYDASKRAFVVTLYDKGQPVQVTVDRTINGGAKGPNGKTGIVDIYEQAYAQHFGWPAVSDGGSPSDVMEHVTGNGSTDVPPLSSSDRKPGPLTNDQWTQMRRANQQGQPTVMGTIAGPPTGLPTHDVTGRPVTLMPKHAYTVVGMGPNWVDVRDPLRATGKDPNPVVRLPRSEYEKFAKTTCLGNVTTQRNATPASGIQP